MTTPTLDQLKRAVTISEQISALKRELTAALGTQSSPSARVEAATVTATAPGSKKSKMSAAGRARIVAAQKARWAKIKANKPVADSKAPAAVKPDAVAAKKGRFSKAHLAKLAAAAKARWAKIKEGKAPSPFGKKK